jgi:hypothetical protein
VQRPASPTTVGRPASPAAVGRPATVGLPATVGRPAIVGRPGNVRPEVAAPPRTDNTKKPPPKRVIDKKPEIKRSASARAEIVAITDAEKPETTPVTSKTDKKRPPGATGPGATRESASRTGRTPQDVKSAANVLYRAKDFSGAASLVTSALPSFTGGDAQDLRTIAAIYLQLGKSYNIGMASGTRFTEAYIALLRARGYDRDLGAVYIPEIEQRLATTASRAASSFMAAKEYESAFQAVRVSDSLGSATSQTNKAVREKLEEVATELVRTAQSEIAADPEAAKKKLRQVQGIVETKHAAYVKATKLLSGP